MSVYDHRAVESRWQAYWEERKTFATPNPGWGGFDPAKPKFYVLDMFPYPSGVGLHVGHPLGYIATDITARYKRMRGFNVLHPMGFDAFGLPAEQFAVEHGVHPRITTEKNIANMVRQLRRLGLGYDWDRQLSTTDVGYYRWTQWIFLQLYNSYFDPVEKKAMPIAHLVNLLETERLCIGLDSELISGPDEGLGVLEGEPIGTRKWAELSPAEREEVLAAHRLAYIAQVPVNWCPALGTVLANEEVTNDGRSERGNHPVFKRPLRQWMLRITAYAGRLGSELELVEWPEPIKMMQRNWIGRSEGALVEFEISNHQSETIRVFTTRPDTLFGATYMVLAPEHPLVDEITTPEKRGAVKEYQRLAASRSDMDRAADVKKKTGVFTGAFAVNPVNQARIPVWIADYVMMGYGTGAIMAVPAHDERDYEFAKTFELPIVEVVRPQAASGLANEAFSGDGVSINSANDEVSLDGLPTPEAKKKITHWLEQNGLGKAQVQYKLRDWLFSRQRYWGEPFPVLHAPDGRVVALDESELPVELPPMDDFSPTASDDPNAPPRPPLSRAPDSWRYVVKDGVRYERELNTMPQWAGSCWYYLRFCDPDNSERFVSQEAERYWMKGSGVRGQESGGIDLYVGGAEHAVLHLLYSRFWHKVLYDLGHVSTPEPFGRLFNQGYIQAYAYQDDRGMYADATKVEQRGDKYLYEGREVTRSLGKMGKSLKNAVAPDDVCEEYGADTLRLYEMYMGPLDASKPWEPRDIVGLHRFIQRVWRNFVNTETGASKVGEEQPGETLLRLTHATVKRVTDSMDRLAFNTAIAALIEMNNELVACASLPRTVAEAFVRMLAPLAPHIAEELWNRLGHTTSVATAPWPQYDAKLLVQDRIELPVQIQGKVRGRITVPANADQAMVEAVALADEKVKAAIAGKPVKKVIVVPGKLVNIVT